MAAFMMRSLLIMSIIAYSIAVDRNNFKTCDQSGFCKRCRGVPSGMFQYNALFESVEVSENNIRGLLSDKDDPKTLLTFQLDALVDSTYRLRVNEAESERARFQAVQALIAEPATNKIELIDKSEDRVVASCGSNNIVLHLRPFKVEIFNGNTLVLMANARGRFKFEAYKPLAEGETPESREERFKEHVDTQPYGHMAVAMDFSFPTVNHVYGIPEHADSFSLKSTRNSDPYRLYNLDVFEYELDSKMSLYGSVPFMMGHGINESVGLFWLNAAETWIDIEKRSKQEEKGNVMETIVNFISGGESEGAGVDAYFMSESGIIDVFFMTGPHFYDVTRQYCRLTGTAPLPPYFALGYHQCRWNYNDEHDVAEVVANFDNYDLPMDVMWLDIEHTDQKKYFTWDPVKFAHPTEMINNLTAVGRKLVVIIDPHLKRDNNYQLHNDATSKGLYVKTREGTDYDGWCWPGSSSFLDFFNPATAEYYMERYLLENYKGSTEDLYVWNDLNEPAVFSGPEITAKKDVLHYGGWEHRDVHNIYGLMMVSYTYEALLRRSEGRRRPFILTRSHFAGIQRYAAIWTGDNAADWGHLKMSIPMCLTYAVSGISFCGADVGGFFGNPDAQLFSRWYQAGAYIPFFRGHAHLDTRRREPWLFDQQTLNVVRAALRERYSLLPYWYTRFYEHESNGSPVMRPLFAEFPKDTLTYGMDTQFLVGNSIMVRPVTQPDVSSVDVYFPGESEIWYDRDTAKQIRDNGYQGIPVTMEKIPVFIRGGSVIPRKYRIRRSSILSFHDPYTLEVYLDIEGKASGELYIDRGDGFAYRKKEHLLINFSFANNFLTASIVGDARFNTKSTVEKVVIYGIPNIFKKAIIEVKGDKTEDLSVSYDKEKQSLTIRNPAVLLTFEWALSLH